MGTTERKMRQKEEVYDSILSAAWKLVKEDGWQGLSIRKIAEAIEYSIPVVYDHFDNKEAILAEFTKKGFRLLNEQLKNARKTGDSPESQLKAVAAAYCGFAFTNSEYYQLMYGMGMPGCEAVNRMPELRLFTETLLDTVKALSADGDMSESDSLIKMKSFWSTLHGVVSLRMMAVGAGHTEMSQKNTADPGLPDAILQESVNNFLAGIREEHSSPHQQTIHRVP
jgi:AcrR family transcriptional regulator